MLDSPPLSHLSKHLLENHDPDWMFEFIDWDGEIALNCFLPTDTPETFVVVSWADYSILAHGNNVPQGLIDIFTITLEDGERIYLEWELSGNAEKWA
jgi:hypothetical protein|tara:strand:+ start:1481 stop:1771 length:291 start_codon:yes stop_codon:yes gene_type:complete